MKKMDWTIVLCYAKKIALQLLIFLGALFTPLLAQGIAIMFFVAIDTITGVWASIKRRDELIVEGKLEEAEEFLITSKKLRKAIPKFITYSIALTVALIFTTYFSVNLLIIVAFFLASVEVKSIFENLSIITKIDFVHAIADVLSGKFKRIKDEQK